MTEKKRAGRNRTITLTEEEREYYRKQLVRSPDHDGELLNRVICGDCMDWLPRIPDHSVDLLFLDPPYNLNKTFHSRTFNAMTTEEYARWMEGWFVPMLRTLKPDASIYVCGDWRSSASIFQVLTKYVQVRNRITWEREKGRGAKTNWKNASEDIWFATVGKTYYFNVEAVKLKRRVIAPYRHADGRPKDWEESREGAYRLTHPSNLWTDLTVPFWSMPENTDHPTQKPEKLLAKVILASTRPGDVVLDPFLGSGTTAVVASKLGRHFYGIEREEEYALLALKRLKMAMEDPSIQGYQDGVFWERNTWMDQMKKQQETEEQTSLFDWEEEER